MHPVGIPYVKLLTKFEICSPNNFLDIWDRLPQILASRDLGHAPCDAPCDLGPRPNLEKIIGAPARLSTDEPVHQI